MGVPTWHFVPTQDNAPMRSCDDHTAARQLHAARCALVAVLVAGLVSSCGSSGPSDTHSASQAPTASRARTHTPATSAAPTATGASSDLSSDSPARQLEKKAVVAYLGMWSDFAAAGHTSNWKSPLLSQHATAYALQVMEKSLYTDHQNGVITKGAPVDHPRVKSINPAGDPTVVLISDCGNSSHTRKYAVKTGKPTGSPGGRQAITAEVRKQPDGSWKVDQFAVEGVGTC